MDKTDAQTSAEEIDEQWAQLDAKAAKLGLSTEEYLEQRLTDLADKDPERYAELMESLASSALKVLRGCRHINADLARVEAKARAANNTETLDAVRDMRRLTDDSIDQCGQIALMCGEGVSRT